MIVYHWEIEPDPKLAWIMREIYIMDRQLSKLKATPTYSEDSQDNIASRIAHLEVERAALLRALPHEYQEKYYA